MRLPTSRLWVCCTILATAGCLDNEGGDVRDAVDSVDSADVFEASDVADSESGSDADAVDPSGEVDVADEADIALEEADAAEDVGDAEVETEVSPQPPCPVAVITTPETAVVPGTLIHLYGNESYSPAGGLLEYRWQVDAPADSESDFVPRASIASPTFVTDVAGTYRFSLTVIDQRGLPGCVAAVHEVSAQPNQGLRVELTWVVPNDFDPTDDIGPDLDLHFLHPLANGEYFNNPFDSFWGNDNPNWGAFASTVDNPELKPDNTSGSGPEVLTLVAPEEGLRYCVGVNVWTDHDFGPSQARLRILVDGEPMLDVTAVELVKHDLWKATCFTWPIDQIELTTIDGALDITPKFNEGIPHWFQP